ncbi:hypothetical protein [Paraburkholderia aspalathi]|uniref:hypothetical protein n=1 Tax=Paraburkholderia aspalathi TaxID=1324617 RepID=UPI001B2B1152|nr:hypothetical protein [Paraburkholderia aspalathi]CAE6842343.1 hypothetical protein R20943_07174 [Paraburkholderia aspalathi]
MSNTKLFIRKVLIVIGSIALVTSLGFSGVMYIGNRSLERTNKEQSDKLAKRDKQIDQLNRTKTDDESQLASMRDQLHSLQPDYDTLKQSVGAFATQAAACETIKQSLNIKS